MSTRHAYQWSGQNEDFNHDLEFWTCFPEVLWIRILDVLRRGPMDLNFGCASQRSNGFKFGRAFQRSNGLILDVLPRGPMELKGIIHIDVCGLFTLIPAK